MGAICTPASRRWKQYFANTRGGQMATDARRTSFGALIAVLLVGAWPFAVSAGGSVAELMTRDLAGVSGKEVRVLTVDYPPGGASLPHRHNAQVFVYVLAGAVRMQIEGAAAVTLRAGDTYYEGLDDIHTVSANASSTEPARLLVFIVKDKGAPISSAVTPLVQP
jgi:quercetin dioxygenase-like cupin family protein